MSKPAELLYDLFMIGLCGMGVYWFSNRPAPVIVLLVAAALVVIRAVLRVRPIASDPQAVARRCREFNDAIDRWILYVTLLMVVLWWVGY